MLRRLPPRVLRRSACHALCGQFDEAPRSAVQAVQHLAVAQEQLCQGGEIVAVPVAGHVGFARAEAAAEGDVHPGGRASWTLRVRCQLGTAAVAPEAAAVVAVDQGEQPYFECASRPITAPLDQCGERAGLRSLAGVRKSGLLSSCLHRVRASFFPGWG